MATKRELDDDATKSESKKPKLVDDDSDDGSCSDSSKDDSDEKPDARWKRLVENSHGKTFTMIVEAAEDGQDSMIYWIPDDEITDEDRSEILLPIVEAGSPESKSWDKWLEKSDKQDCWGKYGFFHFHLAGKVTRLPISVVYTWASWY